MPKKYRLSRADWIRLPRSARRIHGTYFSLTMIPFPPLEGSRVACVVSKKVAARAVDRNRIERLCKETLRPLLKGAHKPLALIFHAKREAQSASGVLLKRDIEKLLRGIDLGSTMPTP